MGFLSNEVKAELSGDEIASQPYELYFSFNRIGLLLFSQKNLLAKG